MSQTTYPHQDSLIENKIAVNELPEKTQKLIKKFTEAKDEETKEALDEKIFGDIEDFVEANEKKSKEAAKKEKHAAVKNKKVDVSSAPTATGKAAKATDPVKDASFTSRFFGR